MERGLSEFELIDRLRQRLPAGTAAGPLTVGIGDDASITSHTGPTATSVDAVVEGVHFRREWSTAAQIAAKAVATALSDLAAMAADPGEAYVTLGLPPGTDEEWVEALADGFVESAGGYGVALAGGDTVASPVLFASVTVVGRAPEGERLILRSGAAEGDLVGVTGDFGGAAAGLILLGDGGQTDFEGFESGPPGPELRSQLISRHVSPRPLLAAGAGLRGSGVSALIDVSDGLLADLGHVAEASGVAIEIDPELVPAQAGVSEVAESVGRKPVELTLAGGEDYELAMTLPAVAVEPVRERLERVGSGLTIVGEVVQGKGIRVTGADPGISPLRGFDHFR